MNGHADYWLIHRLALEQKPRIQAIQGDDSGVTSVRGTAYGSDIDSAS